MPANLEGRVFDRQQRFANLPTDLQQATRQFEDHVKLNKGSLFQEHHHALVKTVYSVKGKDLIDALVEWIDAHGAGQTSTTHNTTATPSITAGELTDHDTVHAAAVDAIGQPYVAAPGVKDTSSHHTPASVTHHVADPTTHRAAGPA